MFLTLEKELKSLSTIHRYNGSLVQMLSSIYPEHEWLPWKFKKCPSKYWESDINKRKFLEWVGNQLGVKRYEDWYTITAKVNTIVKNNNFNKYRI